MSALFEKGDRVKVTIEGTVNRVLNFDGTQELRIDADGLDNYVYTDAAKVEKVGPRYETFEPGTLVRGRVTKVIRVVTTRGVLDLRDGEDVGDEPTSRWYERVEVG